MVHVEDVIKALRVVVSWDLAERGCKKSEAAKLLDLTPAAISQYASGKRGSELASRIRSSRKMHKIISDLSCLLIEDYKKSDKRINFRIMAAAEKILPFLEKTIKHADSKINIKSINKILRARLIEEQKGAEECATILQGIDDEFVRELISIIEIDSARHAKMVSLIMDRLNKQKAFSFKKSDIKAIEHLIKIEESADDIELSELKIVLGPVIKTLIESMEADERKHLEMLNSLQKTMKNKISYHDSAKPKY